MSTPNVQQSAGLTSSTMFGIQPQSTRLKGGPADAAMSMHDPSQDTPTQAANRAQALGIKALIHPHHSIAFWMVAGLLGVIVLNGRARGGKGKKKG